MRQGYIVNQKKNNLLQIGQGLCFFVIALNLLWAFFAESILSRVFPICCIGITGLVIVSMSARIGKSFKVSVFAGYVGFVIWCLIGIFIYGFIMPNGSQATFLLFTMPGYAIFFVRMFVSVLPCMLFVDLNEFKIHKFIKVVIFVVLLVSVFFVLRAVAIDPDALRTRATEGESEMFEILRWTPGYAMVYAYAIILPAFLHKIKVTTKKTRVFYLCCTLMIAYIVMVSQFATALLLAIVGTLVYLLLTARKQNRIYIIFIMALFIYIVLVLDGGADIFRWLSNRVSGTWATKLNDIAETLSSGESTGTVSDRTVLYLKSWQSFLKSPLLGGITNVKAELSGHATALDVLGSGGLFAFMPFCMYIYGTYARMRNHTSYTVTKPAVIACVLEFVLMAFLKNMITSMAVFFAFSVMVPLLLKSEEMGDVSNELREESNI